MGIWLRHHDVIGHYRKLKKVQPNTNLLNIRLQKELGRYLLPVFRKKYKTVRHLKKYPPKFCFGRRIYEPGFSGLGPLWLFCTNLGKHHFLLFGSIVEAGIEINWFLELSAMLSVRLFDKIQVETSNDSNQNKIVVSFNGFPSRWSKAIWNETD